MPRSKISFKKNVLQMTFLNVELNRGSGAQFEGLKAQKVSISLDVADLLLAKVPSSPDARSKDPGVMLLDQGENWIQVIKVLRTLTGWTLKEAKALADDLPGFIGTDEMLSCSRAVAPLEPNMAVVEAYQALEAVGARTEVAYEDEPTFTVMDLLREKLTEALGSEAKCK